MGGAGRGGVRGDDQPAGRAARDAAGEVPFSSLEVRREVRARDGTVKALFATADGRPLEAVLMRYGSSPGHGRRSICLSSQSGCPLTCTFCATGQMRFARNLTASEILDQALHFRRIEPMDHCVFMGMGEPLMNLDAVLEAASGCRIWASPIAARRSRRWVDPRDRTPHASASCRCASRSRCTRPTKRCAPS